MTRIDALSMLPVLQDRYMPSASALGALCARDGAPGEYCVGGIVCKELLPEYSGRPMFPTVHHLAGVLLKLHPFLQWEDALYCANQAIQNNDKGFFAEAWHFIREALT